MKRHNVEQGTAEWKELRREHFTASDAPAMMGASKYKSRNALLLEAKTGRVPEVSPAQQELYDKGHAAEASARTIIELQYLDDFPPVVGSIEVDGLRLLASFDGLSDDNVVWEHKLWNATLAENVFNCVLEDHYIWQLEQQCLVAGADTALFTVSDGTEDKMRTMEYRSDKRRQQQLIAGWKQFARDLESFTPTAKAEAVEVEAVGDFPIVQYRVEGTELISNIADILPVVKQRAREEMNRTLETDADFAQKEQMNKAVKKARAKLKEVVEQAQGEFTSFSEFVSVAREIDSVLQQMQSHGEKQVKLAKEQKKQSIIADGQQKLTDYINSCDKQIMPLSLWRIMPFEVDWKGAVKGKRVLTSVQSAVDDALAKAKIEIDRMVEQVRENQLFLADLGTDYSFLFADIEALVSMDGRAFRAVVKERIADHEAALKAKAEQEAEKKTVPEPEDVPVEETRKQEKQDEPATAPDPAPDDKKTAARELLRGDIERWALQHSISDEAVEELLVILRKYGA